MNRSLDDQSRVAQTRTSFRWLKQPQLQVVSKPRPNHRVINSFTSTIPITHFVISRSSNTMQPKRPLDSKPIPETPKKTKIESTNPISSATSTPTKAEASPSPKKTSSAWSPLEEQKFLEAIDRLVKIGLWAELKGDEDVARRGANGVRSHWDALVSLPDFPSYPSPLPLHCILAFEGSMFGRRVLMV